MSEEAASTPTTTSPAAVNIKVEEGEDMFEGLFLFSFQRVAKAGTQFVIVFINKCRS